MNAPILLSTCLRTARRANAGPRPSFQGRTAAGPFRQRAHHHLRRAARIDERRADYAGQPPEGSTIHRTGRVQKTTQQWWRIGSCVGNLTLLHLVEPCSNFFGTLHHGTLTLSSLGSALGLSLLRSRLLIRQTG